ncbi:MAG: SRPBCC domain-containing protein [Acidobacteria bacterium]|nr:SRPBCC domain-containing protein [Acidobacteriota bacterium]
MSSRKHDIELEVAAPRELVWQAITEGAGITRWFAPEAQVEPGEGGSVFLSWGPGMEGKAPITIWDPGRRFGWTEHQGSERPRTVELTLAGEGGSTTLRLVHSGFGADASFDAEYESTHGGWHTFLAMLRFGLERHPGTPAKNVTVMRMSELAPADLRGRLAAATGTGSVTEGARHQVRLAGQALDTTVLRAPQPGYVCLSVDVWADAILSLFAENCGGASVLTLVAILFGESAEREPEVRAALEELAAAVAAG